MRRRPRALAQAEARLADASDEARQSVADAGEQVRMLLEAAETQRRQILAEATGPVSAPGRSPSRS